MFKPILKALPALALSVSLIPSAMAQIIEYRTSPAIAQPIIRVMPRTYVYTAPRKVITVPTSTVTRSVVVAPVKSPEVVTTTTITEQLIKSPNFDRRLSNMKDQINLGASRGWLTSGELAHLNSEHDRLASLLRSYQAGGLTNTEIDDLEKQFTRFNQLIAADLNNSETSVAGTQVVPL